MRPPLQFARRWRLRLPARTARLRLTLLYTALFIASGAGLLAITYLLVSRTAGDVVYVTGPPQSPANPGAQHTGPTMVYHRALPARLRPAALALAHQRSSDLHHLLIWSAFALAIMALVSIALGHYAAGRVLKPLRTITGTARAISARNLHERLALAGPDDEFKALGDTLDDLFGRLQTSFQAQRHFVANASHELRTPLAWEQTLLQVALANPNASNATLRATCEKVLAASRQQQGLVEALLTLASSERGLDHREPVDLCDLADAVLLASSPEAERHQITITAAIQPAPTTGRPALLERLITNLIDNAVRHNTPGGQVHVQTTTTDGHAVLLVANTGRQIPPDEIERLFERFQRLEAPRTNGQAGYGLGLSIVQAITTAHDGQLTARPRPGGGLEVQVVLNRVYGRRATRNTG